VVSLFRTRTGWLAKRAWVPPRMVKILECAENMGDVPTRRTPVGKRYSSNMDRVTLCYFRFGMLFPGWSVQTAIMIGFMQIEFVGHTRGLGGGWARCSRLRCDRAAVPRA